MVIVSAYSAKSSYPSPIHQSEIIVNVIVDEPPFPAVHPTNIHVPRTLRLRHRSPATDQHVGRLVYAKARHVSEG